MRVLLVLLVLFLVLSPINIAAVEPRTSTDVVRQPKAHLCLSFNPETNSWGPVGSNLYHTPEQHCPAGHAYFANNIIAGPKRSGDFIAPWGTCCPVPEGILTEEHSFHLIECPPNSVATGGRGRALGALGDCRGDSQQCGGKWRAVQHYMRCTKIDTRRFALSQTITPGLKLGWGRHFSTMFQPHTTRSRLPLAIRYGIGRSSLHAWDDASCVGYPFGSLLVKKTSKRCHGFFFKQVLYRGAKGDPPAGTPVEMFPQCANIDDPFSPDAKCLN